MLDRAMNMDERLRVVDDVVVPCQVCFGIRFVPGIVEQINDSTHP